MEQKAYLVCATPRTGSTLICEMLRESGGLGSPREYFECLKGTGLPRQPAEYFGRGKGPEVSRWMGQLDLPVIRSCRRRMKEYQLYGYRRYLPRILRLGTTSNGIFGAKIMWGHLHDFLVLHTGEGSLASSHRIDASLRHIFPNLKYIYVTRQSKLHQAVSLWIALQTQRWRVNSVIAPTETVREPIFHFEAIDFLRRQLIEQDAAWQRFFTAAGIAPLMLDYEQFSRDLPHALMRVVEFLELGCEPFDRFVQPSLVKQADGRSEEFVRMYESCLVGRATHIQEQRAFDREGQRAQVRVVVSDQHTGRRNSSQN